jgi:hypothetical protein
VEPAPLAAEPSALAARWSAGALSPQHATCGYHNTFGEEGKKTNISKMLFFVLKKLNFLYSYEVKRKYRVCY